MASGCGDVLSLEDLKAAKLHQIFEAEVITGRSGGVAAGSEIDFATNLVTGQVQKTMPAILRDIGYEPAGFDFTTGGTLTATDRNKAVLWPLASGGDGDYYYWEGALPKVIPAASTPSSTGGVAAGAWRPVGDLMLRTQLATASSGAIVDDTNIPVKTPSTGGFQRTQHSKNQDTVTASDFGAIADGTYHPLSERYATLASAQSSYPFVTALTQSIDYAALQAAANATSTATLGAPGEFHLNGSGAYVITNPINIATATNIKGRGIAVAGATIKAHTTFTGEALVLGNSSVRVDDVTFIGSSAIDGFRANKNLIALHGCSFVNCKDSVSFHATDPVFYFSMEDCLFYTSFESDMKVNNTSNGGVDMILSGCRFLDSKGSYCLNFTRGVGSIIADNLQISITGTTPTAQLVNWGIPAPGFGGVQFSNCVFEGQGGSGGSMLFGGAEATPWKAMFFDTCFFTGQNNPAMVIAYVDGLICNACGFSSNISNSVVYNAGTIQKNTKFIGCSFDGSGAQSPFRSLGDSRADVFIIAPRWDGGASLVDFSLCSPNNVSMNVEASSKLATPVVRFPTGTSPNLRLVNDDPVMGHVMDRTLTGTLTGAGMVIAHGVTNLQQKLLSADAYFRGGSGELVRLTITTIDGGNITVNGGVTGRSYVISLRYAGKAFNIT